MTRHARRATPPAVRRGRRRPIEIACLAVCAVAVFPMARAQTVLPPVIPDRPAFVPPRNEGLFELPALPAAEAAAQDDPAATLVLREVRVSGQTAVTTEALQALARPYLGQPVGPAALEGLRLQMTRLYVERGYINSGVLLRRVAAAEGVVEFEVVEGRLSEIRTRGMERLHEAYLTGALQRPGDGPLNIDRLRERFQLLLGDPLFERMNARLLPGNTAGEAVLDIEVTRARPWQLTLFANNYRPVSVGEGAIGVNGWVRNLSGFGDLLEATLQGPINGSGDLRGGMSWRLPLGQSGTQLSLAVDEGNSSVVEEPVRALDITSRLSSREIGLSQTLFESLAQKYSLGVQAVQRENRTWLLGVPFSFNPGEPNGEVRERLWRFWQEASWRSETQVVALRSTFVWGRNNLQTIAGLPPTNQPPNDYRLWLGQAQYARQLTTAGAQFVARATVQRSPDRLLALDGIAIGGVNTVRGYRENQLVRDEGAVLNLELEWPLWRDDARSLRLVAVPFYDIGRGRNHGEAGMTLQSAGLALRLAWQGLSLDLTLAGRIDPPAELGPRGDKLQDQGVHIQLSYRF